MYYLVSNLNVTDVDGFIEGATSWAQEHGNEWGLIENAYYRNVDQNNVIIVNGYKTLEDAQKHKSFVDAPENQEGHKQMGIKSFEAWVTEKRVGL